MTTRRMILKAICTLAFALPYRIGISELAWVELAAFAENGGGSGKGNGGNGGANGGRSSAGSGSKNSSNGRGGKSQLTTFGNHGGITEEIVNGRYISANLILPTGWFNLGTPTPPQARSPARLFTVVQTLLDIVAAKGTSLYGRGVEPKCIFAW